MSLPPRRVNIQAGYGIIFDFDGTLALMSIDFNKMRRGINTLFAKYGIQPESLNTRYILERIDEAFDKFKQKNPLLADRIRQEAFSLIEAMEMAASSRSHLLPGVYQRLWQLKKKGFLLAIATRNCEKALRKVIGKAWVFFDIILTRENSIVYKPQKTALDPILEHFPFPNERIFMIGDHPLDVSAAREASITPIAVLTGTGKKDELVMAGASMIFKHVNQAVDSLFGRCF